MEPEEISEFANKMKESAENGEESLTRISLAISILAVLVAMVTVLGHRTHTEAVLAQARAGDQWNEYQAKKIRWDNLTVVVDTLMLNEGLAQSAANRAAVDKKLEEYRAHLDKWKGDLSEEQTKAHEFEEEVDRAEHRASHYDLGEALLQIAVVVCSVTLFTRRKSYFILGLAMGLVGLLVSASALAVH
jgi:hypothetical protein